MLDDISATDLEKLWYMAKDPQNADNKQLTLALDNILELE